MEYIVKILGRPFYFQDFDHFEVDGESHHVSHGTFRNKISHLMKIGKVIFQYKTKHAYYSIPNYDFTKKTMTQDHAGVPTAIPTQCLIYKRLSKLPVERQALHNLRITFSVQGIWEVFSSIFPERICNSNKDIMLEKWRFEREIDVGITIHHTNTVSVAIACSSTPIAVDIPELFDLVSILTRTELKIASYCSDGECLQIPNYTNWIVRMWHFGVDDPDEYDGEAFHIAFKEGLSILWRIYTKRQNDGKLHLRGELQEYPDKPITEAIFDKIFSDGSIF